MKSEEIKLDKKVLEHRMRLIEMHLQRLKGLKGLSPGHFALPDNFDVAACIIQNDLGDFEIFLKHIKKLIE